VRFPRLEAMKDTQLRGILLQAFYERRREHWFLPKVEDLHVAVTEQDILQVCDQLAQHGMLEWKVLKSHGVVNTGMGKINAFGIDVVEREATPDIKVEFVQNQTINITGSTNVVVGDNNSQAVTQNIRDLLFIVESSSASEEQKNEAKSLLRKFLEHPLVIAVAGGAISLLG
jgi:hypothetical protein